MHKMCECAHACTRVHRYTRVCGVQRCWGDAKLCRPACKWSVFKSLYKHTCAAMLKCANVSANPRRKGKREKGRSPTPGPSESSSNPVVGLLFPETPWDPHTTPRSPLYITILGAKGPSVRESLRQTASQPWQIHTLQPTLRFGSGEFTA